MMSEERFTLDYIQSTWWRITDNITGKSIENKERMVVGWLNSLQEENEQLQKQVKSLETTMNATSDYNAFLQAEVKDLEKENEQLKNKTSFLEKRIKCNNEIGHYTNVQNKKKLLLDEWGEKNEIIKKEKGKEFYLEKLALKYVINYFTGEVNKINEEVVWGVKK